WAAEHVVGIAKGVDQRIIDGLRENFTGECSEVGMYLAMARVAHREGYPEIGLYWEKAAYEEADHAARFAEMLGEVVSDSTKQNLKVRVDAENGATKGKTELAKLAMARYIPTSLHSPVKFSRRPSIILWSTPFAIPTTCSAAQVISPDCSSNLEEGA
ncbi:MAG: hypothetical protein IKI68_03190, partial [Clostridia bacterium]|nr:hypothetical protein [Clostridia bacterium]